MTTKGLETAIETLANHTDMTQREAEAYALRELANVTRGDAANQMNVSESTLDNHVQAAKSKAALPDIDVVKRVSATNTGFEEGKAWEIWFDNGAMLRYVWNDKLHEIVETTTRADDPHSIYQEHEVGGSEDELEEYALESISEFTRNYRDDVDACRSDWPGVFEAILCYSA